MKIDRSAFLVLTGAMAAGACTINTYPARTDPHAQAAAKPPPPPPPAAAKPAAPGAHPLPSSFLRPGTRVDPVILRMAPAGAPPAGGGAAACLDSSATTVPACAPTCTTNPFMAQRCQAYAANMNPKVAAQAIACINGLTGASACDSMAAYNCGKTALSQACVDNSTVGQLCQIAATPCKVAANDCATMLSGLSSPGQDAVAACVAQGCSAGLYSCIEGLSATSAAAKSVR